MWPGPSSANKQKPSVCYKGYPNQVTLNREIINCARYWSDKIDLDTPLDLEDKYLFSLKNQQNM